MRGTVVTELGGRRRVKKGALEEDDDAGEIFRIELDGMGDE